MVSKMKKMWAYVLIFSMIFTCVPQYAWATTDGYTVGNGQAKISFDYLGMVDPATGDEPGFEVQDAPAYNEWKVGNVMWFGVKLSNITTTTWPVLNSYGLWQMTFGFNYDTTYLEPYVGYDYAGSEWDDASTNLAETLKMFNISTVSNPTATPANYWNRMYDIPSGSVSINTSMSTEIQREESRLTNISAGKMTKVVVQGAGDTIAAALQRFTGNTDETVSEYVLRIPMVINSVPTAEDAGKTIIEFALSPDGWNASFKAGGSGSWENAYKSQWYRENAATGLNLKDYFVYSNNANLLPVQWTVKFDTNLDGATNTGIDPSTIDDVVISEGSALNAKYPVNPTRTDGKVFAGWNTKSDGSGTDVKNNTNITAAMLDDGKDDEVTLYAQWEEGYSVTFDPNGGAWGDDSTSKVVYGKKNTPENDPINVDSLKALTEISRVVGDLSYNFEGWAESPDATDVDYADYDAVATNVKETKTVYAIWSLDDEAMADAIKVVFRPNGGKIGDKTVDATEEVVVLPGEVLAEDYSDTTTREGYTFDTTNSWNTAMNGQDGTVVKNGTTITAAMATKVENAATGEPGYKLDVYAQWIATNGYTVEFYTDKDANDTNPYYTTTVAKETKLTEANIPNDPTRDDVNKDFNFWSTVKSGDGEQTKFDVENTVITADLVTDNTLKLYAVWKDKSHKITLDPGLGSFADGATFELDKQVGDKFAAADFANAEAALVVPTASDSVNATYTFSYWATGANGSGKITYEDENCTVTADMTKLYASYDVEGEDVVEVRFDKNGGTTGPDPEVIKVPKGSTLKDAGGLPEEPTRDGYDFAGWYDTQFPTDSDQPVTDDTVVRDGMTVYAKWTPKDTENAIKVNFHHNDGTDTVESITIASDGKLTITIEDPERTGYTALRWESDDDDLTIKSECADGKAVFNDVDITSVVTGEAPNRQANFYLVWSTDVQIDTTGTTLSVEYNTKAQAYTGYKVVDGAGVEVPTDVAGKVVLYYKSAAMDAPSADAQTNAATYELSAAWNETLTPDKHGVVYGETISIEPEDEFEITPVTLTLNVVGGPDAQQQKANKDGNKLTFEIANNDLNEDVKTETTLSEENTAFKIESTYYTVGEDTLTAFEAGQFPTTKGDYAVLPSVGGTAKGNYAICLGEFVEKYDTLPNELNVDKYAKLVVENGIELLNLRLNKSADEGWEAVSLFGSEADVAAGTVVTFAAEVKDYYAQIPFGKDTQFRLTGELPDEGVSVTLNGTEIKLAEKAIYDEFSKTYTFDTKTLGQALIGTKNGSFDNSLVVKLGVGDDAITYTLHIRQLVEAKITLNPGNSPYGRIERMANNGWDADRIQAAKDEFDASFVLNTNVPDDVVAGVKYWSNAWGYSADSVTMTEVPVGTDLDVWADEHAGEIPYINYDKDSSAVFAFIYSQFKDPGFVITDSSGNTIVLSDTAKVAREIKYDVMAAGGVDGYKGSSTASTLNADLIGAQNEDVISFAGINVKPGIYTITYTYTDSNNIECKAVRTMVVLSKLGDVNLDSTVTTPDSNAILKSNYIKETTLGTDAGARVLTFRVNDTNRDTTITTPDSNAILKNTFGANDFYVELSAE